MKKANQPTPEEIKARQAETFQRFCRYIRRYPSGQAPKKKVVKPLEFETTDEFLEWQSRQFWKSKLIADQAMYINGNFEQKRKMIATKIETFLRVLWKEVPPPHLRLEFANVLNFTITYAEFWGWISETINRDYALAMKSFLPCDLIQMFADFFATIENCRRNNYVETSNFAELLKLRDAVITCLQNHYRIAYPIFKTDDKTLYLPNHTADQRYSPYDTEWLCGSVISGPNYLSCVKYLCITRLAQLDIACMRADIIAEKEKIDIDFIESIRVPLPVEATNPKMLGHALHNREFRMKENFRKTKQALADKIEEDADLRFVVTTTEFVELRGDIRRKKKNVMDLLVQCERKDFRPFLQIIAVMSTIEAELLILLRAASQFIDKKLGMYGRALPVSVYKLSIKLFLTTTLESCRTFPLSREITNVLDLLRNEVRKYVKAWYLNHEKNCEAVYTEKIDVASIEQKYMMCYELSREDFTDELDSYVDTMLTYLRLEQIEMERLLCQLCQVKRARWYWPKKDVPDFSLNVYQPVVTAFCSNFEQGMSPAEVETIRRHADFVLHESTMTTSIGEEILLTSQHIMKEMSCVPECMELSKAFKIYFKSRIGEELVENKTAEELAAQFAEIVIADIDMTNARQNINRPGGDSLLCSQRIASEVCKKYMEYVENPMPSLRIAIPMEPPADAEDSENSGSDDESDYATDEGEVAPRPVASSEDESADDDDDSNNDMESANGSGDDSEEAHSDDDDNSTIVSETSSERIEEAARLQFSMEAIANAALLGVASGAIFVQDPLSILDDYDETPDDLIDDFLFHFDGINRNIDPELAEVD